MDTEQVGHLLEALVFAADKHRDQRRKDQQATPYINHPIGLVSILWHEAGIHDPIVLIAALLHDTVEDTDTQFTDLSDRFGSEVEQVVRQVTDDKSLPKDVRKQLQIDHAAKVSDAAKLVKLADKTYNLRDLVKSPPAGWSLERQRAYCEWAKRVVDQMRGVHPTLEDLFDAAYADAMARNLV
ncbi:HD domain-containing protein [Pseudanabaena sp. FACHB-2040]|uniref:HD domain-containing protein n=1 Tax=Pseudanabaena sp. FACHB-2040 TaxID=2692859 RepID=UPI0016820356|nr:HD domain-containing protein [Pseudanabaena sp. FACHB-2040]MBD2259624.1 bifunctional (p)ppGpp synthetase/guanosine-3',5'-bis(diphosphate) 3'-pyrophosphohydrolase [Pseudanabaena sp. FACHB-2040]